MGRILPGTLLGCAIAFLCLWAIEAVSGALYPLPGGFDPYTAANQGVALQYHVPLGAKLLVIGGWCLGTLIGGGIAALISRRRIAAWIVAALIVAGALATARSIAHPAWMSTVGLLLPWACALAAQRLATIERPRV